MGFENGRLVRAVMKVQRNADLIFNVNTIHYDLVDPIGQTPNSPQSLADVLATALIPKLVLAYDNTWTVMPVEVTEELDPQNDTAARASWTSGSPTVGTRTGATDRLPTAACGVATLRTDHVGRRHRGRLFLGGTLMEIDQVAGVWQSTLLAIWQNYLDAIPHQPDIATGISTATADWCVYSRKQRQGDHDPYASHVASTVLRSPVRWLRSRQV